jgi:hypothetical protein
MYPMFKVICEELPKSKAPHEGIISSLQEMFLQYNPVYRDTWRFILRFLSLIGESNSKLTSRNISTVFSDIVFKPIEYKNNDMMVWRLFNDLLTLMINEYERIFEGIDKKL